MISGGVGEVRPCFVKVSTAVVGSKGEVGTDNPTAFHSGGKPQAEAVFCDLVASVVLSGSRGEGRLPEPRSLPGMGAAPRGPQPLVQTGSQCTVSSSCSVFQQNSITSTRAQVEAQRAGCPHSVTRLSSTPRGCCSPPPRAILSDGSFWSLANFVRLPTLPGQSRGPHASLIVFTAQPSEDFTAWLSTLTLPISLPMFSHKPSLPASPPPAKALVQGTQDIVGLHAVASVISITPGLLSSWEHTPSDPHSARPAPWHLLSPLLSSPPLSPSSGPMVSNCPDAGNLAVFMHGRGPPVDSRLAQQVQDTTPDHPPTASRPASRHLPHVSLGWLYLFCSWATNIWHHS